MNESLNHKIPKIKVMSDNEDAKQRKINEILFAGASARIRTEIEKYQNFPIKISIERYSYGSFHSLIFESDEECFVVKFDFPYGFCIKLILPVDLQDSHVEKFAFIMEEFSVFDKNDRFIRILLFKHSVGIFKKSGLKFKIHRTGGSLFYVPPYATIDENFAGYLPVEYVKTLFEYLYAKNGFSTPYSIAEEKDCNMIVPKKLKNSKFAVIRFDIEGEYKIRKIATKYPNPFFNKFEDDLVQFLMKIEELRSTDKEYLWKAEFKLIFPRGFSIEN